jgi:hypothetical protein
VFFRRHDTTRHDTTLLVLAVLLSLCNTAIILTNLLLIIKIVINNEDLWHMILTILSHYINNAFHYPTLLSKGNGMFRRSPSFLYFLSVCLSPYQHLNLLEDCYTERCSREFNTCASCSGDPQLKCRPIFRLSWMRAFVVFLSLSKQLAELRLKLRHDRFLPRPFQIIIHPSSFHSTLYTLSHWNSVVKHITNNQISKFY